MDLSTTNVLLGIMAATSVIEVLIVIGLGIAGFVVYRRTTALIEGLEQRHVAPLVGRANDILDDVRRVTAKVRDETERVDRAIHHTVDRVDDTAERVRSTIRARTARIVRFVRGARSIIETFLQSRAA
jgi:hypothetical protein